MTIIKRTSLYVVSFFASLIMFSSCIADEAQNTECDIVSVILPTDLLNRAPVVGNRTVNIILKNSVPLNALAPDFTLTEGATITPPGGTVRDFSTPQIYTVTSQDGKWSKDYIVTAEHADKITLQYNFENIKVIDKTATVSYDEFCETDENGDTILIWASANAAFALTMQGTTPNTFPCYQVDEGKSGKCAVLVTRSTGSFGAMVKKPIAAGTLFLGNFDMNSAMSKPLEATHFGVPFTRIPVSLSGVYKYFPGETYCQPNAQGILEPVEGKTDSFNIYAVMFEITEEMQWLNGTNVLSADNPNIIGTATFDDADLTPSSEWRTFTLPFVFREGKSIDPYKLESGLYSITIVMSSSRDGDFFSGAVGSTLYVDELDLNC